MQSPLSSCLPVGHPTMQNHIATYRNPPELTPALSAILQYRTISLPTQYLGLPLTIKKSPKMAYIPMLTAVQQRYEGYKGKTPINGEANNSDEFSPQCNSITSHASPLTPQMGHQPHQKHHKTFPLDGH
jgi:hypothetical protein